MTNSELLINKLEQFIRKYYKNRVIRASILFVAAFSALFISLAVFEYFTYSNSLLRAVLFYAFIAVNLFTISMFVVRPALKIWGIGSRMSYEDAARIIGKHFPEIDDKLLNTLQLKKMSEQEQIPSVELLLAAIDEKIKQVKPFRFQAAVNIRKNLKYVKYAAVPLLLILFIFIWDYHVFTEPTQRIVNYNQYFEKPAPYKFIIENEHLTAFQSDDFTLNIRVEGEEIPVEVFIKTGNATHKIQQNSKTAFSYEFKNLQKTTDFQIFTEEVKSQEFQLEVIPKPMLIHFSMQLEYPNYTGKPSETIENRGDITVPQGTRITWKFNSRNTDEIIFGFEEKKVKLEVKKDNSQHVMRLMDNFSYTVFNKNKYMTNSDSLQYFIHVIPDQYPAIEVVAINDSAFIDRFYFKGTIGDDYGFTKLHFVYTISNKEQKEITKEFVKIPLIQQVNLQEFYHYFDAQTMQLEAGQTLEYYFEIWDNDQVNGSKSTKSTLMTFTLPTLDEIQRQSETVNQQTRTELSKLLKDSEKILKEIDELKKKMVDKNQPSWQEKKQLEDLLKKLQDVQQNVEHLALEQQRQQQINEQYNNDIDQQILEKQQELQKRFEELFTDEMKMMMQELQRLMESNIDKNKMNEMLDKIKLSSEEINKQLDQNLELFKHLEVESKMENIISKTNRLAEEQEKLAEKTLQKDADMKQQQEKQNKINQEFKDLQQELKELEKLNKGLEDPYNLEKTKELEKEVSEQLNQAKEQLEKNQKPKANESQKKAGEKMKEMANQMQTSMEEEEMEQLGEDIHRLRQVLDNIVKTSFQQEELMQQIAKVATQDPAMRQVIQNQFNMKDNLKMIADSLSAIARRQVMVKPFIVTEITKINQAQEQIMELLHSSQEPTLQYYNKNRNAQIASKQQFVMTSLNDLALMIHESLKNMQKNKQQGGGGKGSCKSDKCEGGSKSKPSKSMRQMQEQLNKQLEEARKKMEQGDKEGGEKKGSKSGQSTTSEEFARMAAQQEAIRKMMKDQQSEMKKEGKGYGGDIDKMLKDMEEVEKDLVNKRITQQTINRQQQILTRLLESERAEMQREKEEKRESREARQLPNSSIPPFIEQQLNKKKEIELYKTIPPTLNNFYKDKVNAYFYWFEGE